jgi:hypothetical protein
MRSEPIACTRREFVKSAMLTTAAVGFPLSSSLAATKPSEGERPRQDKGISVINPWGGRVPVSFIIDDSACLVNMAYFGLPQFMEAWPGHRKKFKDTDWKNWPQEIPDSFVLKFGVWCRENGVKGKYSIVPFPACVGWVDRVMPGWSRTELRESLKLVRDECLNQEVFLSVTEARVVIEEWRSFYNRVHPHSGLGFQSPDGFARIMAQLEPVPGT